MFVAVNAASIICLSTAERLMTSSPRLINPSPVSRKWRGCSERLLWLAEELSDKLMQLTDRTDYIWSLMMMIWHWWCQSAVWPICACVCVSEQKTSAWYHPRISSYSHHRRRTTHWGLVMLFSVLKVRCHGAGLVFTLQLEIEDLKALSSLGQTLLMWRTETETKDRRCLLALFRSLGDLCVQVFPQSSHIDVKLSEPPDVKLKFLTKVNFFHVSKLGVYEE